jgi:monooxygenase
MAAEHFDVLIMGAGLSGIDAAWHLQKRCPGKSYVILEQRERIGGTWDLFRYPGIRSDSDMLTMGYSFRPWTLPRSISPGDDIRGYITDTAQDAGIDHHIRFRHHIKRASWSSQEARWTVEVVRRPSSSTTSSSSASTQSTTSKSTPSTTSKSTPSTSENGSKENGSQADAALPPDGEPVTFTCNFLFSCAGYYRYSAGYLPEFPNAGRFRGRMVHPQAWPEDLDYAGKRVLIVGSGATAVTLLPAMAKTAARVTMLQRSPGYVISMPERDRIANGLRRVLPSTWAYRLSRWKNIGFMTFIYQFSQRFPEFIKRGLLNKVREHLGTGFDVDTHFTPRYRPWEQRMCLVPDGDMFAAIKSERADVVTDQIETFTERGILLKSGRELEADIIVTATGLVMQAVGGVEISVDGQAVDPGKTFAYKGVMMSGVPNLASVFGYINASWTLKADLICNYVCRLLNRMDRKGVRQVTPRYNGDGAGQPFVTKFTPGYIERALANWPRQGAQAPWLVYQNYFRDTLALKWSALEDGALEFSNPPQPAFDPAARELAEAR